MIETDRVAPVVFAALCVLALGASATSLQSTVSTDPSEVINLDYDRVPIGRDQASEIRKEVEASAPDPGATSQRPPEEQSRPTDGGQSDSQMLEQAQTGDQQIRSQSGAGPSSNGQGGSFTTWLVGLSLLLLALCVLAYRYRRRLAALLSALTDEDRPADPASQLVVDVESSNPVYLAWGELVDSIDVETPTTKTPRESATVAIDAGYDP